MPGGGQSSGKDGLPSALLTKWNTPFDHYTSRLKKEFLPLEPYPNHLTEEKCQKIHEIYKDAVQETAELERVVAARIAMLKRKRARAVTAVGWQSPSTTLSSHHHRPDGGNSGSSAGTGSAAVKISSSGGSSGGSSKGKEKKQSAKDKDRGKEKKQSAKDKDRGKEKKQTTKDKDRGEEKKQSTKDMDREKDSSNSSAGTSKQSSSKRERERDGGGGKRDPGSGVSSKKSKKNRPASGSGGTAGEDAVGVGRLVAPAATVPRSQAMIPKKKKKRAEEKSAFPQRSPAWASRTPKPGDQVAAKLEKEDNWILATVLKVLASQNMFLVVDDDGGEGKHRQFKLKRSDILTFPKAGEESGSVFPPQTKVMALYPRTTTFYPATITAPYIEGRNGEMDRCVMQFQDDDLTPEGNIPEFTLPAQFVRQRPD